MSRIVLPTSADWDTVDLANGLLMVDGRLAELEHPELWEGCVGAWTAGLDGRAWDYSQHGRHGGNGTVNPVGGHWALNGTNQHISIGDYRPWTNSFMVMAWARAATHSDWRVTVGKRNGGTVTTNIRFGASGTVRLSYNNGSERGVTSGSVATLNRWHALCGGHDPSGSGTGHLYLDGTSVGTISSAGTGNLTYSTEALVIGSLSGAGFWFSGDLTDVMIFSRWSESQCRTHAVQRNNAYLCRVLPRVFLPFQAGGGDTFTASAALTSGASTLSASATFAPGTKTATAALSSQPSTLAADAEHDPPVYTAAAALASQPSTLSASATFAEGTVTASAALVSAASTLSATAEHDPPVYTASAALTSQPSTLAADAEVTNPTYAAEASLTSQPTTLAATALHSPSVSLASAALASQPTSLAASAAHDAPVYTAAAALIGSVAQLSAAAQHVTTSYTATASLAGAASVLGATGVTGGFVYGGCWSAGGVYLGGFRAGHVFNPGFQRGEVYLPGFQAGQKACEA